MSDMTRYLLTNIDIDLRNKCCPIISAFLGDVIEDAIGPARDVRENGLRPPRCWGWQESSRGWCLTSKDMAKLICNIKAMKYPTVFQKFKNQRLGRRWTDLYDIHPTHNNKIKPDEAIEYIYEYLVQTLLEMLNRDEKVVCIYWCY